MERAINLAELLIHAGLAVEPGADQITVTGLAIDSRKVKPGDVFAALPGVSVNGAAYIEQAEKAGAVAIVALPEFTETVKSAFVVSSANPRRTLAKLASAFYPKRPPLLLAVTGTNGKTSVAHFVREAMNGLGRSTASIGTLGAIGPDFELPTGHTTPEPTALHRLLDDMSGRGVTATVLEASSHGLDQGRLDGVKAKVGGFTNLTQDHLDYHKDFHSYFRAKLTLFSRIVIEGGTAVVNADSRYYHQVAETAMDYHQRVISYGKNGRDVQLVAARPHMGGQMIEVDLFGERHVVNLPLVGDFQASNVLCAIAMLAGAGMDARLALKNMAAISGVPGRAELIGTLPSGAAVYVDYAHTPDALDRVLAGLRPHTRHGIKLVFGCGGDRDKTKRQPMGRVAARYAKEIFLTDDNPRTEDPAEIREGVLMGCPQAQNIGDRQEAITRAIEGAKDGEVVVIAGKGAEDYQEIGTERFPFDDREIARTVIKGLGGQVV